MFKKDDKYFPNTITVALNHKEKGKHPVRIIRIKPGINKYNWKRINEPSEKDDWKKFEKNSLTITNNVPRAKKENSILFMFQSITEIVKNKPLF